MTTDYQLDYDWFAPAAPFFATLIPLLPERKRFLEVGSFEGSSTIWLIENMMTDNSDMDCIDAWGNQDPVHVDHDMKAIENRFDHNIKTAMQKFPQRRVRKLKGFSHPRLAQLITEEARYDFIFIDGSHAAPDVLTDACMAFQMLKSGGIMIFDDYEWEKMPKETQRPKMAVNAFARCYAEQLKIINIGYQVVIQKI